jgi:hypothetical protein
VWKLDGDAPSEVRVFSGIDCAHSTFTEFFNYAVMGDCLPYHGLPEFRVAEEKAVMKTARATGALFLMVSGLRGASRLVGSLLSSSYRLGILRETPASFQ